MSMPSTIERNWSSSATALAAAPSSRLGSSEVGSGMMPPYQRKAKATAFRIADRREAEHHRQHRSRVAGRVRKRWPRPLGRMMAIPIANRMTSP